jgi:hypothetical protein
MTVTLFQNGVRRIDGQMFSLLHHPFGHRPEFPPMTDFRLMSKGNFAKGYQKGDHHP